MSITLRLWLSQLISTSASLNVPIPTPAGRHIFLLCVGNSGTNQSSSSISPGKRKDADPLHLCDYGKTVPEAKKQNPG